MSLVSQNNVESIHCMYLLIMTFSSIDSWLACMHFTRRRMCQPMNRGLVEVFGSNRDESHCLWPVLKLINWFCDVWTLAICRLVQWKMHLSTQNRMLGQICATFIDRLNKKYRMMLAATNAMYCVDTQYSIFFVCSTSDSIGKAIKIVVAGWTDTVYSNEWMQRAKHFGSHFILC